MRVVSGDILYVNLADVLPSPAEASRIRVVGNLPYNISSPILFRLLEAPRGRRPISDATVMLQKEVADRLVAAPGTSDYGVLTVLLGRRARMTHLLTLPPGAFRPPPKVTSAVVRLDFLPDSTVMPAPPGFDAGWCVGCSRAGARRSATHSRPTRHRRDSIGAAADQHRNRPAPAAGDADDSGVRAAGGPLTEARGRGSGLEGPGLRASGTVKG